MRVGTFDAIKVREIIDINGGDDVDDGVAIEPQPTRHEVPKAVSTISKYIDELDDPLSRKIEGCYDFFELFLLFTCDNLMLFIFTFNMQLPCSEHA